MNSVTSVLKELFSAPKPKGQDSDVHSWLDWGCGGLVSEKRGGKNVLLESTIFDHSL